MLFNSFEFCIFAAIFFVLWPWLSKHDQRRWGGIVVASLIFYGWVDWRFIFLLIFSGFIDYLAALGMGRYPKYRKNLLMVSVFGNLGGLVFFKYSLFFANIVDHMFTAVGVSVNLTETLPEFSYILPVGISFYTFQSMSYTIDVYTKNIEPVKSPLHFFAFLAMFPQLVAGPIVRAAHMLHQLAVQPHLDEEKRWQGSKLVVSGLFKKMVIADNLAPFVDSAFSLQTGGEPFYWFAALSMFAFQIYYDFSGYSDIARGLVKWMGYDININFSNPYIALSLKEFWQRWHISLSTWFRDYVYIPLGGSHRGALKAYRNLWISFLLSGLWHGAGLNYLAWGALHAFFINMERVFRWPEKLTQTLAGRSLSTLVTIALVWFCWTFFRAESIEQAVSILGVMSGLAEQSFAPPVGKTELFFLGVCFLRELFHWLKSERLLSLPSLKKNKAIESVMVAMMVSACVLFRGEGDAFIYFQF